MKVALNTITLTPEFWDGYTKTIYIFRCILAPHKLYVIKTYVCQLKPTCLTLSHKLLNTTAFVDSDLYVIVSICNNKDK